MVTNATLQHATTGCFQGSPRTSVKFHDSVFYAMKLGVQKRPRQGKLPVTPIGQTTVVNFRKAELDHKVCCSSHDLSDNSENARVSAA